MKRSAIFNLMTAAKGNPRRLHYPAGRNGKVMGVHRCDNFKELRTNRKGKQFWECGKCGAFLGWA